MAHPEEPTLPEDIPVQRKNKNINNVLHDISRFLLSEIQRRAFRSPRSVKQQEGHGDGRQTGAAGGHAEQHQRDQRRQEAGGGRCAAGAAAAGGGILSGGNTAAAGYHRPRAAERKLPKGDQCGSVRTPLKKCSLTADDGAWWP